MDSHSLNTPARAAQPSTQPRRRYGPDFVGPRLPRGRQADPVVAFKNVFPPLSNTGGKSTPFKCHSPMRRKKSKAFSCKVDWLTFMSCLSDGELEDGEVRHTISGDLGPFINCLNPGIEYQTSPTLPRKFFLCGWILREVSKVPNVEGTQLAWIGVHQSGKWMVDISGSCCPFWDFPKLASVLEAQKATITRLDLAADDYEGTCGVSYAKRLYDQGAFITNGTPPRKRYMEGSDGSRTFYVGQKGNGKELCVYEKGKEQKSKDKPDWVRWELRLGNKDRVIPYDAMKTPAPFFLGAFDFLPDIFPSLTNATPEHIATTAREHAQRTMEQTLGHARRSYGPAIYQAVSLGMHHSSIVEAIMREPKQLVPFLDAEACRLSLASASVAR